MGYPMTWERFVKRNHLEGGYDTGLIAGDARRLEADTQDDLHIAAFARIGDCDPEAVRRIFAAFFTHVTDLYGFAAAPTPEGER